MSTENDFGIIKETTNAILQRMDKFENQFEKIDIRFGKIEDRFDKFIEFQVTFVELKNQIDLLNHELSKERELQKEFKDELKAVRLKVENLESVGMLDKLSKIEFEKITNEVRESVNLHKTKYEKEKSELFKKIETLENAPTVKKAGVVDKVSGTIFAAILGALGTGVVALLLRFLSQPK
jgi:predicted  nucleic acid-binding Zn-ribbon protein